MPPDPRPPRPDPGFRPDRHTPRQRAQAVRAALTAAGPGPHTFHTPSGTVVLNDVRVVSSPTGGDVVEIHADSPENGDPEFRVINPPRFVPDPAGDVIIGGQPFREDPLAALAHVVAQHGGRFKDARRGTIS